MWLYDRWYADTSTPRLTDIFISSGFLWGPAGWEVSVAVCVVMVARKTPNLGRLPAQAQQSTKAANLDNVSQDKPSIRCSSILESLGSESKAERGGLEDCGCTLGLAISVST